MNGLKRPPTARPGNMFPVSGLAVPGFQVQVQSPPIRVLRVPEFNPIEMCWPLMKSWIRRWAPRAIERLTAAIDKAWRQLTPEHCRAWIRHSGYAVSST